MFLPVLLLRILRDLKVCGPELQILRPLVVCSLLDTKPPKALIVVVKGLFSGIGFAQIAAMQAFVSRSRRWIKPVFAGLMAPLVLVLSLFASSERLHLKLHGDANVPHQSSCAVCTLAQGQLEFTPATVSQVVAALSISWTLPCFQTAPEADADFSVASSRGPPASVSSL